MSRYCKKILKYYLRHRPLFLALIRSAELPFYGRYADFSGRVLDFGCGDGFFLYTLKKFYPFIFSQAEITGIDVDKKKLKEAGNYQVYHQLTDVNDTKLSFAGGNFNSIISNCVLEHIKNLEIALRGLNRLLKKNGRLYITVMVDQWERYLLLPKKWWRQKQQHYHLYSVEKWEKVFKRAGFKVIAKKGYLNKKQSRIIEIMHFVSLPYLISYKLFGDWSKAGWWYEKFTPVSLLTKIFTKPVRLNEAGAVFFVLQK